MIMTLKVSIDDENMKSFKESLKCSNLEIESQSLIDEELSIYDLELCGIYGNLISWTKSLYSGLGLSKSKAKEYVDTHSW